MPNRLPVPEELLHLIEKRDTDADSQADRRADTNRRHTDLGPIGTIESVSSLEDLALEERRTRTERRAADNRRKAT